MRKCWHRYGTLYEAVRAVVRIYSNAMGMPLDTKRVVWWIEKTMRRQCDFDTADLAAKVPQVLGRLQFDDAVRYEMGVWRPMPGKIDDFGNVLDPICGKHWSGL